MKTIRSGCRLGVGLLTGLLLVACASTSSKLNPPRVTLVGASMLSADVFNQQFRVRVKIENPNAAPLRIKTINYKLFLETDSFAEGASVLPLVVPANDEKEFDLTVQTNFASSIGRLLSRLNGTNSNTMQYTFSGDVVIDASFSPKLKFAESGTVNLSRR